MTALDDLARDYRVAFLGYLPRREEAALTRGYQLGRSAVDQGVSILELAQVHHDVLVEVLRDSPADGVAPIASAASEFFLEVLATFDMTQRSLLDERSLALSAPNPRPGSGGRAPRPRARTSQTRSATGSVSSGGT
jgi:hypothetical protein